MDEPLTFLTSLETQPLEPCEIVIEQGLKTFVDVGTALLEIRDKRLYRARCGTFEDYCQERWGFERRQAYRLMDAAQAVENVSHGTQIEPPKSERQARPLTRLEPEQQREVWQQVIEETPEGKITGAKVQEVVDRLHPTIQVTTEELDAIDKEDDHGCWDCQHGMSTRDSYNQHWCAKHKRLVSPYTFIYCDIEDWEPEEGEQEPEHKNPSPHVTHNSGNNEWYTPPEYIEAAHGVMGQIDLDPASSDLANKTVRAATYYTVENNGLFFDWAGCVWMNPPYSSDSIGSFCKKLAEHVQEGDVTEACVLVNNATETGWFNTILDIASAVCLIKGRVKFIDTDGNPSGAPLQGQIVLYIGESTEQFASEFSKFGRILYARRDSV